MLVQTSIKLIAYINLKYIFVKFLIECPNIMMYFFYTHMLIGTKSRRTVSLTENVSSITEAKYIIIETFH